MRTNRSRTYLRTKVHKHTYIINICMLCMYECMYVCTVELIQSSIFAQQFVHVCLIETEPVR